MEPSRVNRLVSSALHDETIKPLTAQPQLQSGQGRAAKALEPLARPLAREPEKAVPVGPADPALAHVVAAWDGLPEAVRAAVLLLVDSAGKRS